MVDLKKFRKDKNISQSEICSLLKIAQPYLSAIENGKRPLGRDKFDILYKHFGYTILEYRLPDVIIENVIAEPQREYLKGDNDIILIPLYNTDARAGMSGSNEVLADESEYIVKYIPFQGVRKTDRCFPIYGDSMSPTYPPGIVLGREVENWREYFGYGNVFYIFLKDGRRILKQVNKYTPDPKNYIVCHSYNPNYADEELPKTMIKSVWKVIKAQIETGW